MALPVAFCLYGDEIQKITRIPYCMIKRKGIDSAGQKTYNLLIK